MPNIMPQLRRAGEGFRRVVSSARGSVGNVVEEHFKSIGDSLGNQRGVFDWAIWAINRGGQ